MIGRLNFAARIGAAMLAIGICAGALAQKNEDTKSLVGKSMPEFSMTTLDGKTITNADLKGKVVLLDFWATWCPPCKKTSPVVQKLHETYGGQGVTFIGADCWEKGDAKDLAQKYVDEHKYSYTVTIKNDELSKTLMVRGIPTLVLVDGTGVIRNVFIGYSDKLQGELEAAIKNLMKSNGAGN